MFIIIWQYTVRPEYLHSFIEYYHSKGTWVKLFQQSPYYFETEFIQLDEYQFVTIDKWANEEMYRQFLDTEKNAYKAMDVCCEKFTCEEIFIGSFYLQEL